MRPLTDRTMSTPVITAGADPGGAGGAVTAAPAMRQRQWSVLVRGTMRQWRSRIGLTIFIVMVLFAGRELWGENADPTLNVSIEAFEPYLEAA